MSVYNLSPTISIQCGGEVDASFEVYEMSLSNPACSSSDDLECESKDAEDNAVEYIHPVEPCPVLPPILQSVKNEKWAVVYASVEQDDELAKHPITMSFQRGSSLVSNTELLLHYVCKSNAPAAIVACVLQANPEAASSVGSDGYLPLHYACNVGAPIAVVEALLDNYPGAVKIAESQKSRLALHLAARHEGSVNAEVIALLLSYYPEASLSRDAKGKRPIDYAAVKAKKTSKKARWETIAVLEMGEKWVNVGHNVTLRLEADFAERLRVLMKEFGSYVESLKALHDEEIAKIANDLLEDEFAPELLAEELKLEKEAMEKMNAELQTKLDVMVQKHDRFLQLQEASRMQRLDLEADIVSTQKQLVEVKEREATVTETVESQLERIQELEQKVSTQNQLVEEKGTEAKLTETVESQPGRIQDLEENVSTQNEIVEVKEGEAKVTETVESRSERIQELEQKLVKVLGTEHQPVTEKEEQLMARVAVLEKAERIKAGVIKRITAMARGKEEESKEYIMELVEVIDEQQDQINSLLAKLDLCEEQIHILKQRLDASKVDDDSSVSSLPVATPAFTAKGSTECLA